MAELIRVLCVHGVNVDEKDSSWQPEWIQAIETGFKQAGAQVQIETTFLPYNDPDEYKHGVTSYGAFTYSLARLLRRIAKQGEAPTFDDLVKLMAKDLTALDYDQHPVILGPKAVTSAPVPWRGAGRAPTKRPVPRDEDHADERASGSRRQEVYYSGRDRVPKALH